MLSSLSITLGSFSSNQCLTTISTLIRVPYQSLSTPSSYHLLLSAFQTIGNIRQHLLSQQILHLHLSLGDPRFSPSKVASSAMLFLVNRSIFFLGIVCIPDNLFSYPRQSSLYAVRVLSYIL